MKMSRSIWFFSFATVAMAGFAWVVADAQTLGKRKLPGSLAKSNVSNLPVSYPKEPFQYTISAEPAKTNGHETRVQYFAPMLSSGPDVPAEPEFQFKIVGINTGVWEPIGGNKMEYAATGLGGKLQFQWDKRAKVLKMMLRHTTGSGGQTLGPAGETFAIDVTMIDNEAKIWYFTRFVRQITTSG